MKMAKASEDDINLSMEIAQIVDDLEKGYRPWRVFGEDDGGLLLDMDSIDDLRAVVEKLQEIARRGSMSRVVLGMAVALDPKNEIFDPAADVLAPHPTLLALERDAKRYRFLREADTILISTKAARDPVAYDEALDLAMLKAEERQASPASGRPDQP